MKKFGDDFRKKEGVPASYSLDYKRRFNDKGWKIDNHKGSQESKLNYEWFTVPESLQTRNYWPVDRGLERWWLEKKKKKDKISQWWRSKHEVVDWKEEVTPRLDVNGIYLKIKTDEKFK